MQKLKCRKTGKGVWLTKGMMDHMRTLKLLGVNFIDAPAVSINHLGKDRTHHMGNYYSVEYQGDNRWQFFIEPITLMRFR
ncbi:hypothetical protein [Kosakonia phage Kc283]|uniref:Uncharacterized protein n=1 Tax=Kosakonia phage Kc283 TaxID=2863195 RepID=A0AAE8BEE0_9CAUD|nr:hypothetical protein PP755_gp04 [Kosakonia phage Kc283]QYN79806.1 hypothetical protein [Kosakonia phage Kc283]